MTTMATTAPARRKRRNGTIAATVTLRLDAAQHDALLKIAGGDRARRATALLRLIPTDPPPMPMPKVLPAVVDAQALATLRQALGILCAAIKRGAPASVDKLSADVASTLTAIRDRIKHAAA